MPKKTVEAIAVDHHGKPRWRVIVPRELNNGTRRVRFFKTKGEAGSFATDLNEQRAGSIGVILAAPANVQEAIVRALRSLGDAFAPRIDEAAAVFLKHVMAQPRQVATVATVVAECLASKESAGRRPRYLSQLKHSLHRFTQACGLRPISELTPLDIERWLNGNQWAAPTRRSYLTDCCTLYAYAIDRGYCLTNMAARVERPDYEDKAPPILTPEDTSKLLAATRAVDPGLIPYVALCLFAGIRPAEAALLTWADILPGGYVQIEGHKAKTRKRRLVTILPVLKDWLALKGDMPPTNLRKRLKAVRLKSGIVWGHDVMRHSFASYHLAANASAEKTALELGHSGTNTLFAHYRELVSKEAAEAFFNLSPAVVEKQAKKSKPKNIPRT